MLDVLQTTKYVVDHSENALIDKERIGRFVKGLKKEDFKFSDVSLAKHKWRRDSLLRLFFIFNAINFCYWAKKGEEKWTVDINGELLDGAVALFRCLENEARRNLKFLTGEYLSELTSRSLGNILKGNIKIPLFRERLECLNEVGEVLCKHFNGDYINLFKQSQNDALKLTNLVVTYFPRFNDSSEYKGKFVAFYKRAQINAFDVNEVLIKFRRKELKNIDKLTVFADYKVPQTLRKLGILQYSKTLGEKIDGYELLPKDSPEENEIRAATVWAAEYIRKGLIKKVPYINACLIDNLLWFASQKKSKNDKPYHRTLTIAY